MKVGDLVRSIYDGEPLGNDLINFGIIVEIINSDYTVPPVCKIFWHDGTIEKEWRDDVEVIDESQ